MRILCKPRLAKLCLTTRWSASPSADLSPVLSALSEVRMNQADRVWGCSALVPETREARGEVIPFSRDVPLAPLQV